MKYEDVNGEQLAYLVPGAEVVVRADYGPCPQVGTLKTGTTARVLCLPAGTRAIVTHVERVERDGVTDVLAAEFQLIGLIEYEDLDAKGHGWIKRTSNVLLTDGFQATLWRPLPNHPWWAQWAKSSTSHTTR